jgi:transmembrane sensor
MTTDAAPIDDDLFEDASRWCLRLRDSSDPALLAAHRTWLAGDPRRAAGMAEARALLGMMRGTVAEPVRDGGGLQLRSRSPTGMRSARPPGRQWRTYGLAASLVAAVAATTWLGQGGLDRLRGDTVTAVGEIRRLQLEDGSVVTLNTNTALKVAYGPEGRAVRLDRGEAFFEVAHDPSRPFVVDSPAGSARVLGTAFDVRLAANRARVDVVRGAVGVSDARGGGRAVLRAGQGAWLEGRAVRTEALGDVATTATWRQGRLVFYRRPLSEVVAEIGRYRGGVVHVRGQALRDRPVSGVFDVAKPDVAIEGLVETLHLRSARLGRLVTIIY